MTKYTPPTLEVPYTGQYPDMIEFEKPWETSIQVSQGQGKISRDGKPLQSEGFGQCFALILRNKPNLESALFHVDDFDLTRKQTPFVGELIKNYLDKLKINSPEKPKLLMAMEDIINYQCPENYGRMKREDFQQRMKELNSNGIMQARFVRGEYSRNMKSRIIGSLLGYLGVDVVNDLTVNTGKPHWSIVYKSKEDGIYIDVKNQKKVLKFIF